MVPSETARPPGRSSRDGKWKVSRPEVSKSRVKIRGIMALLLVSACNSGDPRCSAANCQSLLSCDLFLAGEANFRCLPPSGGSPELVPKFQQYCIDVCNAGNSGALLQCVSTQYGGLCADGGRITLDEVNTACPPPPCGNNCMTCQAACQTPYNQCLAVCPALDAGGTIACLDCSASCGEHLASCNAHCPTN